MEPINNQLFNDDYHKFVLQDQPPVLPKQFNITAPDKSEKSKEDFKKEEKEKKENAKKEKEKKERNPFNLKNRKESP